MVQSGTHVLSMEILSQCYQLEHSKPCFKQLVATRQVYPHTGITTQPVKVILQVSSVALVDPAKINLTIPKKRQKIDSQSYW